MNTRQRQIAGTAAALLLHGALLVGWLGLPASSSPPLAPVRSMSVNLLDAEPAPTPEQAPAQRPVPPVRMDKSPAPLPARTLSRAEPAPLGATPHTAGTVTSSPAYAAARSEGANETPVLTPPRFDAAYLANPPPPYPRQSRRLNESGRVVLRVRVNAEGLPTDIEISRSSGFERLDEAARLAVSSWKFIPARQGERAISASVLVPIAFTLD